jgi:hypothetical protein
VQNQKQGKPEEVETCFHHCHLNPLIQKLSSSLLQHFWQAKLVVEMLVEGIDLEWMEEGLLALLELQTCLGQMMGQPEMLIPQKGLHLVPACIGRRHPPNHWKRTSKPNVV